MANFVATTRLLRTATGTADAPVYLNPPLVVTTFVGLVKTLEEARQRVPLAQRWTPAEAGGYALDYTLRGSFRVVDLSQVADDPSAVHMLVWAWETKLARTRGDPPALIESFTVRTQPGPTMRSKLIQVIRKHLVAASLAGTGGDTSDPRRRTVPLAQRWLTADAGLGTLGGGIVDNE